MRSSALGTRSMTDDDSTRKNFFRRARRSRRESRVLDARACDERDRPPNFAAVTRIRRFPRGCRAGRFGRFGRAKGARSESTRASMTRNALPRNLVALVIEPKPLAIAEFALQNADETARRLFGVDEASALRHVRFHPAGV